MNKTGQYIRNTPNLLSVYFTADYPYKGCTRQVILGLQESGVGLIEVGIPFSDPMADGPAIQQSSQRALQNGFNLARLFEELTSIRTEVKIPLILMGYFNTVLAYGVERFLEGCNTAGIDTVILPDLPLAIYESDYREVFAKHGISPVFLVCPQTPVERLRRIDTLSQAFIYAVADNSVTGSNTGFSDKQIAYFERLRKYQLYTPLLIGFGISNHDTFSKACEYGQGAIIGSAFIRQMAGTNNIKACIGDFVKSMVTKPDSVHGKRQRVR